MKENSTNKLLQLKSFLKGDFIGYRWSNLDDLPELNSEDPNNFDWSGFYTCLDYDTAVGYLVNKLPDDLNGNGIVYMHEIYLKSDIKIFICNDKGFKDGSYKYNQTVEKLKRELNEVHGLKISNQDLLIPALGKLGYGFQCFHDTDNTKEIVIPHILKPNYLMSKLMRKYIYRNFVMCSQEDK